MKYYLAYGSNMSVKHMDSRCPHATLVGTAELKGYRLLFKGSRTGNYLTVEKAEGYSVPCLIWKVDEVDERRLDRYEGYPEFYHKLETEVVMKKINGGTEKKVSAFFYQMDTERELGVPSGYYYDLCRQAYLRFGFDRWILAEAYVASAGEVVV